MQEYNTRPHTARVVQQFPAVNNVKVLPWSAQRSPDLSPIDLWNHIGAINNAADMRRVLLAALNNIPGLNTMLDGPSM